MSKEEFKVSNMFIDSLKTQQELYYKAKIEKIYQQKLKDLQQKVEQLEKENIKQKEIIENLTTMTVCGDKKQIKNTAQYKLEQLENIRKEAIEMFENINLEKYYHGMSYEFEINDFKDDLLNILNKGSESNV